MGEVKKKFLSDANKKAFDIEHRKTINYNISRYNSTVKKGREQFKGIKVKKKLILSQSPEVKSNKKPLSLLGFIV